MRKLELHTVEVDRLNGSHRGTGDDVLRVGREDSGGGSFDLGGLEDVEGAVVVREEGHVGLGL